MSAVDSILAGIRRVVAWSVGILLLWMVCLSLVQLLLRWMTSTSMPWADLQLRQMVLWVGLLGGVLAAADHRHIRIDIVEHFVKGAAQTAVRKVVLFAAALMLFYLTYHSYQFLQNERVAGVTLDGMFFGISVPIWTVEVIIPVCFFLMGLYFLGAIFQRERPQSPEAVI